MRICILTQPLHTNYGGLLQAFALQFMLKKMGHEVWTVDWKLRKVTYLVRMLSIIKHSVLSIIYRDSRLIRVWPTNEEQKLIAQNTNRFIKEYICTTKKIHYQAKLSFLKRFGFEVYIVGSDQVWRPKYSPCIKNFFLNFIGKNDKAKRLAYAASFGVEMWEFSPQLTSKCAALAKKFDAIYVREESAVKLCKLHLGVNAIVVLDPTLLLRREEYIKLIEKENIQKSKGNLMKYVLDNSSENTEIIDKIAKELNLTPFSIMPEKVFSIVGKRQLDACVFPPVTKWLRGFFDAEYVVTDSFHGTIFSIIFNKPFITIGNPKRGMTRFTTLLNIFGLEERLILSVTDLTLDKIRRVIDFNIINDIIRNKQEISIALLREALSEF